MEIQENITVLLVSIPASASGGEPEVVWRSVSGQGCERVDKIKRRLLYQEEQCRGCDLPGLGESSIAYLGGVQHQNQASLKHYGNGLRSGELPLFRAHQLSGDEMMLREFVLQLKLAKLELSFFKDKFGVDVMEYFREILD